MQIYTAPVMLSVSEGSLISKHTLNPATACSMTGSALNFSSSPSWYYWKECDPYDEESGGAAAGLLILLTSYLLEFLLGAPSNLWLICHILRKRSKVSGVLPADFFPLHLALTQFSFHLVVPVFFTNHLLWQSMSVLAVITVMTSMVLVMKPLLLCMVCVERYMAVVRPLDYLRFKARHYRWGCLGTSWCIYILIASTSLVNRSTITVCMVFLPVLVIDTFCSVSILRTLKKPPPGDREMRKTEKQEQSREEEFKAREVGGRSDQRGKKDMNSMKRKAFATVIIIQAVLMLNYLPFIVCLPLKGVVPERILKCQYLTMALAAAASCTYLQPLLYLHRLGRLPFMKPQQA